MPIKQPGQIPLAHKFAAVKLQKTGTVNSSTNQHKTKFHGPVNSLRGLNPSQQAWMVYIRNELRTLQGAYELHQKGAEIIFGILGLAWRLFLKRAVPVP